MGVVTTIPGPGFTNTLTGLAEARADSAALLLITVRPAESPGRRFQLQRIDQAAIAAPLVKRVFDVRDAAAIGPTLAEAHGLALAGEPGPVLVQLDAAALAATSREAPEGARPAAALQSSPAGSEELLDHVLARLVAARRPVLLVGQGAARDAEELRLLVERCAVPVLTTPSGRGALPEDHPFSLGFDPRRCDVSVANALLRETDLVLAVGCKLAHNGTVGFALELRADRLVHVNADGAALGANYEASLAIPVETGVLLAHLLGALQPAQGVASSWTPAEVAAWRARLRSAPSGLALEPVLRGVEGGTAAVFFAALRRALPRDGVVVTDSGNHQGLTRCHFDVLAPNGLVMPSDFQAMGFGVPAAIGARLAAPGRPVVAIVGDGGFLMAGAELLTAVRERVPVTVVVFNDGQLGQIRLQQLREFGRAHAVEIGEADFEALALGLGATYARVGGDVEGVLRAAITSRSPTLLELEMGDSPATRRMHVAAVGKGVASRVLGRDLWGWLKRAVGRGSRTDSSR